MYAIRSLIIFIKIVIKDLESLPRNSTNILLSVFYLIKHKINYRWLLNIMIKGLISKGLKVNENVCYWIRFFRKKVILCLLVIERLVGCISLTKYYFVISITCIKCT